MAELERLVVVVVVAGAGTQLAVLLGPRCGSCCGRLFNPQVEHCRYDVMLLLLQMLFDLICKHSRIAAHWLRAQSLVSLHLYIPQLPRFETLGDPAEIIELLSHFGEFKSHRLYLLLGLQLLVLEHLKLLVSLKCFLLAGFLQAVYRALQDLNRLFSLHQLTLQILIQIPQLGRRLDSPFDRVNELTLALRLFFLLRDLVSEGLYLHSEEGVFAREALQALLLLQQPFFSCDLLHYFRVVARVPRKALLQHSLRQGHDPVQQETVLLD